MADDTTIAKSSSPSTTSNRPPFQRIARRVLLISLLGSVGVLVLLGLLLLFDVQERYSGQAAGTALVVGAWSLLGFAILKALDFSGRRGIAWGLVIGWAMAICASTAAALWLALIWLPVGARVEEELARWAGLASIWTIECLLPLAFLSPTAMPRWAKAIAWASCGFLVYLGVLGSAGLLAADWVEHYVRRVFGEDLFFRTHGAGTIFAFSGLIVVGILQRLRARHEPERGQTVPWRFDMHLACPRCGLEQSMPVTGTGEGARCGRCRLRIRIDVDEPRCACGYVLYKIAGDRCPECGREVAEEDRWFADRTDRPSSGPASPDPV